MIDQANKRQRISGTSPGQQSDDKRTVASSSTRQLARKIHSYPAGEAEQHSSNKKRLSIKHKNALNLTIFAPSYHEQLAGIRSAPINSNFSQAVLQQQAHHQKSGLGTHTTTTTTTEYCILKTYYRSNEWDPYYSTQCTHCTCTCIRNGS